MRHITAQFFYEKILELSYALGITSVRCKSTPGAIEITVNRNAYELERQLSLYMPAAWDVRVYRDTETEEFRREYYGTWGGL